MMNNKDIGAIFCDGVAVIFTAVQPEQILQIISLVLTILSICVGLFLKLWAWWKNAKKDGMLDREEVEDLKNIVNDTKNDIDNLKKGDKK